jgi:hypothetical protein
VGRIFQFGLSPALNASPPIPQKNVRRSDPGFPIGLLIAEMLVQKRFGLGKHAFSQAHLS